MLGELIGKAISTTTPIDMKFPSAFTIFQPIEKRVDGFITEFIHGAIDNAISTDVLNLEGRGWLGMAHIGEDGTDHGTLFGI